MKKLNLVLVNPKMLIRGVLSIIFQRNGIKKQQTILHEYSFRLLQVERPISAAEFSKYPNPGRPSLTDRSGHPKSADKSA